MCVEGKGGVVWVELFPKDDKYSTSLGGEERRKCDNFLKDMRIR